MARVLTASFSGLASSGNVSITGVKAGDRVLSVVVASTGADHSSEFSPAILSDGELLQSTTQDRSGLTFVALLERQLLV